MKTAEHYQPVANSRPDWTYNVSAPRKFSSLWVLESLTVLGVPLAVTGTFAVAAAIGMLRL